jgi:hypothetical protein
VLLSLPERPLIRGAERRYSVPTATEGLTGSDWALSSPSVETVLERRDPEWHTLRLFGRGRHPGAFAAGAEKRDEL